MAQAPVSLPPRRAEPGAPVRLDRLADSVRRLDPATRALLDLSVRRGVRDDTMAPILHTDPFHLAWRRARALEQVASEVGDGERPAPLGEVRMALEALPREAWGLPGMGPPALPRGREEDATAKTAGPAASESAPSKPAASGPAASERAAASEPAPSDPAAAAAAPSEPAAAPAGTALVPTASAELDAPAPRRRLARLDAFASESPTMRLALRQLGRAMAAKAVRLVVWRRSAS
jgi:hypothetical protein